MITPPRNDLEREFRDPVFFLSPYLLPEHVARELENRLNDGCRICGRLRDLDGGYGWEIVGFAICVGCFDSLEERFRQHLIAKMHDEHWAIDHVGYVYFVQREDGAIKIGTARSLSHVRARVTAAKGTLLALERGGRHREQELHETFRTYRRDGEWFRPRAALLAHIISLPPLDARP